MLCECQGARPRLCDQLTTHAEPAASAVPLMMIHDRLTSAARSTPPFYNPQPPLPRHAILITLDHLAASQIGAYGQYRGKTPALDQLASRAAVFHNGLCHAVPAEGRSPTEDWSVQPVVAGSLDALQLAGIAVETVKQASDQAPREWVQEGVSAIRSRLSSGQPGLTWIQGIGISDPWVPDHSGWEAEVARLLGTSWEDLLAEESDEMTPALAVEELIGEGAFTRRRQPETPDTIVERLSLALYAASVEKLDDRLGRLIREFQRHAQPDSLLIIAGLLGDNLPRQWPIQRPVQLHTELVRVPLLVQTGEGHAGGSTILELVQTTDIAATLAEWLLPEASGRRKSAEAPANLINIADKTTPGRPFIQVSNPTGETLVRTPEAQLVTRPANPAQDESESTEWLTLKPEDAWDLLNVAGQHHDLVETLRGQGT